MGVQIYNSGSTNLICNLQRVLLHHLRGFMSMFLLSIEKLPGSLHIFIPIVVN